MREEIFRKKSLDKPKAAMQRNYPRKICHLFLRQEKSKKNENLLRMIIIFDHPNNKKRRYYYEQRNEKRCFD